MGVLRLSQVLVFLRFYSLVGLVAVLASAASSGVGTPGFFLLFGFSYPAGHTAMLRMPSFLSQSAEGFFRCPLWRAFILKAVRFFSAFLLL